MNKKEKQKIEIAIDNLIDGEDGDFDLAIKTLCRLIGRDIEDKEPKDIEYLSISEVIRRAEIEAKNS